MLAMHYAIPLSGADQVASVRARAAERGPLFDGMAGLGVKLFLIDPADPCYATFYLWREADAAMIHEHQGWRAVIGVHLPGPG